MSPAAVGALDDVAHQGVDPRRAGRAEQLDLGGRQVAGPQDPGPQRVVDVVVDVGDAVDQLDDPPLQGRRPVRAGVVEDAVAHLLGQVQALAVALQHVDHPQRVDVVLEAVPAALAQRRVERVLAGVAEGRVAEVVAEPDRLGQVLVEAERAGDRAGDPAGLEGVGEAGAVVVAFGGDEDLRLVLEAAEGLGVDDPVAVALERGAQRAVGLLDLAPRRVGGRRQIGEELGLPGVGRGPRRWRSPPRHSSDPSCSPRRASCTCAWCSSVSPIARSTWRSSRSPASGASASGLAIDSTMKRCASSESGKEPASQPAQTTPPGRAGEADQVLGLAAARAGGRARARSPRPAPA